MYIGLSWEKLSLEGGGLYTDGRSIKTDGQSSEQNKGSSLAAITYL